MIRNSKILITGGTGSLGKELTKQLAKDNEVIVYSRNEERQYEMQQDYKGKQVQFRIGDVRDTDTLEFAMQGCDYVIHAAAMKDLIMCESQPTQTIYNNIEGSRSVIQAARRAKLKKAIAVSTDKAAAPSNVYGSSKYIMEKLFEEANRHSEAIFASVRFGNIIDSKGSLVSTWKQNPEQNIELTHPEASRFFFTVREAAETVLYALQNAKGGEIYIRKMKKAKIIDILKIITKREQFKIIGLFPGEKIHEDLLGKTEVDFCFEENGYYVIRPGQINMKPPGIFSTETADSLNFNELKSMIYPESNR